MGEPQIICSLFLSKYLVKNDLTSESLKDLPKIKWQFLNSINLRQNRIDFRGIELIVNANFLNLKVLLLGNLALTQEAT
jgi:hypothetical protein